MHSPNGKRAFIAGIVMVAIYALQFVTARFSLRDHLTPSDLTILRFGAAGIVFAAIMARQGLKTIKALGLRKMLILALLVGLPYPWIINWGMRHAPAAHAAAIAPAAIMLFSFLLARLVFGDVVSRARVIGLAAVLAGLFLFVSPAAETTSQVLFGDMLFAFSGLMFATYGTLVRRWEVDPIVATASVVLLSCIPLPLVYGLAPSGLTTAPLWEIGAQIITQGLLSGAAAMFLYTYIVRELGSQTASLFMPWVPIATALLGVVVLAEIPATVQMAAIAIMVFGMTYPPLAARFGRQPVPAKGAAIPDLPTSS
ncbi:DMT family transporter [Phyllobacterium sp. 628]|uniref:DMT family transporter n=1 Tax=Phyllobacterium sp. 628 TaxID=2718938 RepID=UPI0016623B45|nr:DMT family transporter [Phyllobacterium sp. 628]QND52358.1 DMT family transporter [Phyllobacterium sp. 628]